MGDVYVRIGGQRMVQLRHYGGVYPADSEITESRDEFYRRAAEALAKRAEAGRAPWMVERAIDHALPEGIDAGPWTGPNAVWLQYAADARGYADPRWDTREAVAEAGGRVRPGERETTALHWRHGGADPRDGESWPTRVFRLAVFNAEQCDGLPGRDARGTIWSHHPSPRQILAVPRVEPSPAGLARYDLARDSIELPEPGRFADRRAYYRVALHEVGHWTGHPDRMDRASLVDGIRQGPKSVEYAREELRAEIHSLLTGCRLGLGHDPARHARFADAWARILRENPREIYRAAHGAERISRYVTARMPAMAPPIAPAEDGPAVPRPSTAPPREPVRGR